MLPLVYIRDVWWTGVDGQLNISRAKWQDHSQITVTHVPIPNGACAASSLQNLHPALGRCREWCSADLSLAATSSELRRLQTRFAEITGTASPLALPTPPVAGKKAAE